MIGLSVIAFECESNSPNHCYYFAVNLIVSLLKTIEKGINALIAMVAMDDIK